MFDGLAFAPGAGRVPPTWLGFCWGHITDPFRCRFMPPPSPPPPRPRPRPRPFGAAAGAGADAAAGAADFFCLGSAIDMQLVSGEGRPSKSIKTHWHRRRRLLHCQHPSWIRWTSVEPFVVLPSPRMFSSSLCSSSSLWVPCCQPWTTQPCNVWGRG